jgi:hypothetical protein
MATCPTCAPPPGDDDPLDEDLGHRRHGLDPLEHIERARVAE